MDKRFQVFVSSTYDDLREERQEVMQALLELDSIPSGMELFPAANDDQWTLIKKVIDDCDYYLVIIGGRYGSRGPNGKSYTQLEYEYALSKDKPTIAFLHQNPGNLPLARFSGASESNMAMSSRDRINEFGGTVTRSAGLAFPCRSTSQIPKNEKESHLSPKRSVRCLHSRSPMPWAAAWPIYTTLKSL